MIQLREVTLKLATAAKKVFLGDVLPLPTPLFENFNIWTNKMRKGLLEGRSTHADHIVMLRWVERTRSTLPVFDSETLHGHLSFKTFLVTVA